MVGYPVALLLVLVGKFGMNGLWLGMTCSWLVAGLIYAVVIGRTNWQKEVERAAQVSTVCNRKFCISLKDYECPRQIPICIKCSLP